MSFFGYFFDSVPDGCGLTDGQVIGAKFVETVADVLIAQRLQLLPAEEGRRSGGDDSVTGQRHIFTGI